MQIEIKNLTHIYNPNTSFARKALEDINISIQSGEFVGIIGHTGSGKSTLIQHLNSLIKPSSGKIFIDGEDINADKKNLKAIRQKVGLVFQYPEHQLFEATVFKDVAFGPGTMGLSDAEINERVQEALDVVGISKELQGRSPFELSGGQKRRAAIAGVLAMRPQILILDEPTAGLDPRGREELFGQIKKMHERLKITIVLVSHSMEDIAKLVSRIIVLQNGKLFDDGTPGQIFKRSKDLENIGLASPQISYLMEELKSRGINVPDDIFTIAEAENVLFEIFGDN
jgi:energy-coupling factor transport system ATP-binding protein